MNSGKDISTSKDLYVEFTSVPLPEDVETINRLELEAGTQVCLPYTVHVHVCTVYYVFYFAIW